MSHPISSVQQDSETLAHDHKIRITNRTSWRPPEVRRLVFNFDYGYYLESVCGVDPLQLRLLILLLVPDLQIQIQSVYNYFCKFWHVHKTVPHLIDIFNILGTGNNRTWQGGKHSEYSSQNKLLKLGGLT